MAHIFRLPGEFEEKLGIGIENASERFEEAKEIGTRLSEGGVMLKEAPDHFAMFTDPPRLLAGPLKRLGYILGADNRCYPSPVDGCDYINVAASLPAASVLRSEGWPDHIAVVHPVDEEARGHMLDQNYGNPFLHHITFGIPLPEEGSGIDKAETLVRRMVSVRERIATVLQQFPGTLILAMPAEVMRSDTARSRIEKCLRGLGRDEYQLEEMEGGGYLLQFFVLRGGRIEVALRSGTTADFQPEERSQDLRR